MADEKKCESCGRWTEWTKAANDRCVHCLSALNPQLDSVQDEPRLEDGLNALSFLKVRESDGPILRALRRITLVAHMVYAAIMAVFMLIVATLVH